jgi:type VI secretion system protein ImpF
MAKGDFDQNVTLSVLDRLIDREPKNPTAEARLSRAQSVRILRAAVKRDLEWLLNTRRIKEESVDANSELTRSLFNYGLPDLTNFSMSSTRDQNKLSWLLEATVAVFEPRLINPKVFMEPIEPGSKQLRFRIDGLLDMDPAPERVTFDTVLDLTSQAYLVKGDGGA